MTTRGELVPVVQYQLQSFELIQLGTITWS